EPRWCCRRCCSSRARTSTTHRSRPQAQASRHSPAARRRRARRPPRGPPSRRARCRARRRRYAWRIFFHIPKCAGSTFEKHFFRSAIGANISILKPCVHTGKPTVYSTIGYDHYPAGFDPDSEPLQCGLNERESCKKGRRAEVIRISIACAGRNDHRPLPAGDGQQHPLRSAVDALARSGAQRPRLEEGVKRSFPVGRRGG
ncbi:unnamed protein product, partial [Prorocentrum cordatum]